MPRYRVECLDRETGTPSVLTIEAEDERAAMKAVSEQGKVIASMRLEPEPQPTPQPKPAPSKEGKSGSRLHAPTMQASGTILILVGVCLFLGSLLFMGTSVESGVFGESVFNLSAAHNQRTAQLGASTFFLAGVISRSLAWVTHDLFRAIRAENP